MMGEILTCSKKLMLPTSIVLASNSSSSIDHSVQESNSSAISQDYDFSDASGDSSRSLFSNDSDNQDDKGEPQATSSGHSSITDNQSTHSLISHNSNSDNQSAHSSVSPNSNSESMGNNSNHSHHSDHSSDTEEYEIPEEIIQINDTQSLSQEAAGNNNLGGDEDDDVILIPAEIETIDLCTQILPSPRAFLHNEVIEIQDSPSTQQQLRTDEAGPSRNARRNSRKISDPYPKKRLQNLDDSADNCLTQSISEFHSTFYSVLFIYTVQSLCNMF